MDSFLSFMYPSSIAFSVSASSMVPLQPWPTFTHLRTSNLAQRTADSLEARSIHLFCDSTTTSLRYSVTTLYWNISGTSDCRPASKGDWIWFSYAQIYTAQVNFGHIVQPKQLKNWDILLLQICHH
jgi:hypothetical protein